MSLAHVVAQSGLSSRVCKLMAGYLGISVEEPKHMPMIRVESVGSGILITSISLDENEKTTFRDLQLIVANLKKVHNTMIGFTDGHGGPIIRSNSWYLSAFPENTVFVSYVKNAKCRCRAIGCTDECQMYTEYGVPMCLNCYQVVCNRDLYRHVYMKQHKPVLLERHVYMKQRKPVLPERPPIQIEYFDVQLERPSVPIEQLLFGASYTSSRCRKTSKSQQTIWYNNNKPVNDVRVQKRTKKSHR